MWMQLFLRREEALVFWGLSKVSKAGVFEYPSMELVFHHDIL